MSKFDNIPKDLRHMPEDVQSILTMFFDDLASMVPLPDNCTVTFKLTVVNGKVATALISNAEIG